MLANVLPHGKKLTLNWLILKFASMLSFKWNITLSMSLRGWVNVIKNISVLVL